MTQHLGYGSACEECPAILCKTLLVGVDLRDNGSINRPMVWYEHLCAQGFPALLPAKHPLTATMPRLLQFESVLRARHIDTQQGLSLAGNTMHMSQVGLGIVAFLLGCEVADDTSPEPEPVGADSSSSPL